MSNPTQHAYDAIKQDIVTALSISSKLEIETGNFLYSLDPENYTTLQTVFLPCLRQGEKELMGAVALRISETDLGEMLEKAY